MNLAIPHSLKAVFSMPLRKLLPSRGFWLVLILFSVLYGAFLARVTVPYQRAEYTPQWGHAEWLTPATSNAIAYYRRDFLLDSLPTHAFIQIAAPDSFQLYVNGIKIVAINRISTAVFDIYDVGNYLLPGRNVIAIRVERMTMPGSASMLANLYWDEPTGKRRELADGGYWRVALRDERQSEGSIAWYEIDFNASDWQEATVLNDTSGLNVLSVHPWAEPELFNMFPKGAWIWGDLSDSSGKSFMKEFDLGSIGRGDIKNAWLGVTSTAPYVLIINGVRGPTIAPTGKYMDTYNIGSFLFAGKNTLAIDTSSVDGGGRLAVAAIVKTTHTVFDLSSDGDWRVRDSGADWQPATVMGKLTSYPYKDEQSNLVFFTPTLRLTQIHLPGGLLLRHLASALPWIASVFLISFIVVSRKFSKPGRVIDQLILAGMLPWILADLMLCVAFFLPFDVRISEAQIFNLPAAFLLAVLPLFLFTLIMAEVESDH